MSAHLDDSVSLSDAPVLGSDAVGVDLKNRASQHRRLALCTVPCTRQLVRTEVNLSGQEQALGPLVLEPHTQQWEAAEREAWVHCRGLEGNFGKQLLAPSNPV